MSSSGRYGRLAYLFLNAKAAMIMSCKKIHVNAEDTQTYTFILVDKSLQLQPSTSILLL